MKIASLKALPLRFRAEKMLASEAAADEAAAAGCEAEDDDRASEIEAVNEPSILPRFASKRGGMSRGKGGGLPGKIDTPVAGSESREKAKE